MWSTERRDGSVPSVLMKDIDEALRPILEKAKKTYLGKNTSGKYRIIGLVSEQVKNTCNEVLFKV